MDWTFQSNDSIITFFTVVDDAVSADWSLWRWGRVASTDLTTKAIPCRAVVAFTTETARLINTDCVGIAAAIICGALVDVDAGRPIYGITGITPTIGVSAMAYEGRGITLIFWPR